MQQILALCNIRLRLLMNTIRSKASMGKIIGMAMAAFIMVIATASATSDLLEGIAKMPFGTLLTEWAIGFLALYAIFVVFTGDLVSGHTLNTGQMSSDLTYLSTLPIPTSILIFTKLFERLVTDYFGILFLLPAFIGIACNKAYTFNGFLAAILLYGEVGILCGLLINLVMVCLTRFFKTSTINNFFSVFGYISAIITLIPFLLLNDFNAQHIPIVLDWFGTIYDATPWLIEPVVWLARPLLAATPFCAEFGKLSILWAISSVILLILFYSAIKHNWFCYAHSRKRLATSVSGARLFSGMFWKEFLMLKSDFNLLINAVFMPISIIAIEIYFMKNVFSFNSIYTVMNFVFGSIAYFSMFGPMNIIGYEGKAIALLEAMPISPAAIIKKKYLFWCSIALIIFIPASALTFWMLGFDTVTNIKATAMCFLFIIASVWAAVCLSAIFAKYDTAVLQQRSTFMGKMAALAVLSIILPVKSVTLANTLSVLIFTAIVYLCYIKAQACIAFRQDAEALNSDNHQMVNAALLLLSFVALETNIGQLFKEVAPNSDTGIWNWALSVAAFLPFVTLMRKKNVPIIPKLDAIKDTTRGMLAILLVMAYFAINPTVLTTVKSDFSQIIDFFSIIKIIRPVWQVIVATMTCIFMIAVYRRVSENFFNKGKTCRLFGLLLVILTAPVNLMVPSLIVLLIISKKTKYSDNL